MLANLFSNAVRDILGRESIQSKSYISALQNLADFDAVTRHSHLEARPHILDRTKYSLSEIVTTTTLRRLTPPDLKRFDETVKTTARLPFKDDHGKISAFTHDEALKKIADYQSGMDRRCETQDDPYCKYYPAPAERLPGKNSPQHG